MEKGESLCLTSGGDACFHLGDRLIDKLQRLIPVTMLVVFSSDQSLASVAQMVQRLLHPRLIRLRRMEMERGRRNDHCQPDFECFHRADSIANRRRRCQDAAL